MNLKSLLAVSRSFFGARGGKPSYAMSEECLLPKFGASSDQSLPVAGAKAAGPSRGRFRTSFVPKHSDERPRRAVQGELGLENVRVVRNDLGDADLELVEAKPRRELAREGASGASIIRSPERGTGWTRMAARFLEVGSGR